MLKKMSIFLTIFSPHSHMCIKYIMFLSIWRFNESNTCKQTSGSVNYTSQKASKQKTRLCMRRYTENYHCLILKEHTKKN